MKINKRIAIVSLVIAVTAITFWSGSRYPSLDQKAIMGGSAQLEDPLSFEASIQIQPDHGAGERILYSDRILRLGHFQLLVCSGSRMSVKQHGSYQETNQACTCIAHWWTSQEIVRSNPNIGSR